jgi:hypothetical protein
LWRTSRSSVSDSVAVPVLTAVDTGPKETLPLHIGRAADPGFPPWETVDRQVWESAGASRILITSGIQYC